MGGNAGRVSAVDILRRSGVSWARCGGLCALGEVLLAVQWEQLGGLGREAWLGGWFEDYGGGDWRGFDGGFLIFLTG